MKDLAYYRWLVWINGGVPLAVLAWDALQGQLGANPINTAIHITGILSLVFLFLSLSITPMHWLTGWGGWIGFRRALGLYGFFYALLHLMIYFVFDRALDVSSLLTEITTRKFLVVGMLAVMLMVPLAVTSTNGMMQRLGPRRWKQLHRLAYVVAGLGVVHFFMQVKSDVREPLAFGAVLAGLFGARLGRSWWGTGRSTAREERLGASRPVTSAKPWSGELELVARVRETPDVVTFRLMTPGRGPLPFTYVPGQYLNVQVEVDGRVVRRSYTLASTPTRPASCELTIKREPDGTVSRHMHDRVQVGDRVRVTAPVGRFTFTGEGASSVLLIAGGVGITPVMSMLRALADRAWPGTVFFLIVAKREQDLIFRNEIETLSKQMPNLRVKVTLTRAEETWTGSRGRPTAEIIRTLVPEVTRVPVYLCGPQPMMDATVDLLVEIGVPRTEIQTEAFVSPGVGAAAESDGMAMATLLATGSSSAGAEAVSAEGAVTDGCWTVRFSRSGVESETVREGTVLDTAEAAGVDLPWECRSGICGTCKVRLLSGEVRMEAEDALSPFEKRSGVILACQARPTTAVTVEA